MEIWSGEIDGHCMWPTSILLVHPSSCWSEFAEKTEVEEMRERREAVVTVGETIWLTLLMLGLTAILLKWVMCNAHDPCLSACLGVFLFN